MGHCLRIGRSDFGTNFGGVAVGRKDPRSVHVLENSLICKVEAPLCSWQIGIVVIVLMGRFGTKDGRCDRDHLMPIIKFLEIPELTRPSLFAREPNSWQG